MDMKEKGRYISVICKVSTACHQSEYNIMISAHKIYMIMYLSIFYDMKQGCLVV